MVPVNNETHLREQQQHPPPPAAGQLRVPHTAFDIAGDAEPTDTLTQNSITSLLSAKFRVRGCSNMISHLF